MSKKVKPTQPKGLRKPLVEDKGLPPIKDTRPMPKVKPPKKNNET